MQSDKTTQLLKRAARQAARPPMATIYYADTLGHYFNVSNLLLSSLGIIDFLYNLQTAFQRLLVGKRIQQRDIEEGPL